MKCMLPGKVTDETQGRERVAVPDLDQSRASEVLLLLFCHWFQKL